MRIVLVNWAKPWDGVALGGGVNGYAQGLALALRDRGHEVSWLCSGTTYEPANDGAGGGGDGGERGGRGTIGPCAVRAHPDWLGVRVFEVINSPVLAPSLAQFRDPMGEVSSPALERVVGELWRRLSPTAVHVQNLEGLSIGCVDAARSAGARVVFSLHNYHTLCPQVYLLRGHRRACWSFEKGRACVGCVAAVDPESEKRRLAGLTVGGLPVEGVPSGGAGFDSDRVGGHGRNPATSVWRRLHGLIGGREDRAGSAERGRSGEPAVRAEHGPGIVDAGGAGAVVGAAAGEVSAGRGGGGVEEARGKTAQVLWARGEGGPELLPEDLTPLENDPCGEPAGTGSEDAVGYGRRRAAMIGMLNRCDTVLAVSGFVREKFVAMGVEPGRVRTMPIGSEIERVIRRAGVVVEPRWGGSAGLTDGAGSAVAGGQDEVGVGPGPGSWSGRGVRMVFMGYNNWAKGLPMLADSLEMLPPAMLARIELMVLALHGETVHFRFRRLEPRLGRLIFRTGYQPTDIPWLLAGQDLGLVPSIWWDNGPQTVLEFQACGVPVLGARIGGIADVIREGENGLLFRANDRADLARRLAEVVADPAMLEGMRARAAPVKTMEAHAAELESVYGQTGP